MTAFCQQQMPASIKVTILPIHLGKHSRMTYLGNSGDDFDGRMHWQAKVQQQRQVATSKSRDLVGIRRSQNLYLADIE